jgi:hypothetical protein
MEQIARTTMAAALIATGAIAVHAGSLAHPAARKQTAYSTLVLLPPVKAAHLSTVKLDAKGNIAGGITLLRRLDILNPNVSPKGSSLYLESDLTSAAVDSLDALMKEKHMRTPAFVKSWEARATDAMYYAYSTNKSFSFDPFSLAPKVPAQASASLHKPMPAPQAAPSDTAKPKEEPLPKAVQELGVLDLTPVNLNRSGSSIGRLVFSIPIQFIIDSNRGKLGASCVLRITASQLAAIYKTKDLSSKIGTALKNRLSGMLDKCGNANRIDTLNDLTFGGSVADAIERILMGELWTFVNRMTDPMTASEWQTIAQMRPDQQKEKTLAELKNYFGRWTPL